MRDSENELLQLLAVYAAMLFMGCFAILVILRIAGCHPITTLGRFLCL